MFTRKATAKAHSLVLRHGYSGASVRMLAKEIGSSTHEIYEVFGGKGQFIKSLLAYEQTILDEMQLQVEGDTPQEVLKSWFDQIYNFQVQEGSPRGFLFVNLACQFSDGDEELRRNVAHVHNTNIKWISSVVGRIKRNDGSPGDREIANFILATVAGSILLAVADRDYWELSNGLSRLKEYVDNI